MALGPLFLTEKYFLVGLGLILYRKQTTRNPTQLRIVSFWSEAQRHSPERPKRGNGSC